MLARAVDDCSLAKEILDAAPTDLTAATRRSTAGGPT
jgi:hypothetical protein